jgi:hypothetical protein
MNELLLFITALLSGLFVWGGWKLGKERLYSVIIVFLILITAVGGKIIILFGHETNTGNIFYASVYLATYFLIERFGRKEGLYSIWVGIIAVAFFTIAVQITIAFAGIDATAPFNAALTAVYGSALRIAFASIVAYMFSQNLNVRLYLYLKERFHRRYLWLRANICNVVSQLLDSGIFFAVAFWGVVAPSGIADIILTGLAIKIVYMMIASPLLYLNRLEEEEEANGNVAVTLTLR